MLISPLFLTLGCRSSYGGEFKVTDFKLDPGDFFAEKLPAGDKIASEASLFVVI